VSFQIDGMAAIQVAIWESFYGRVINQVNDKMVDKMI